MKFFLKKIIFFSFPIVIVLIIVNFTIDPANLFSSVYEDKIATALISGNNITNIDNYDERKLQKNIIGKLHACPQTIVLGSSRTMLINSDNCNTSSFFNSSVSGASIEDILSIYQMYENKNFLPKKIILAIDPWLLNENSGQERWKSIASEYNDFLKSIDEETEEISDDKYYQLISPSYFQSAVKILITGKKMPKVTKIRLNKYLTKLKDGSITYDAKYRNVGDKEILNKVDNFIEGKIYSIEGFNQLSLKHKLLLNELIKKMEDNNTEIVFFLTPYHPKAYEFIAKQIKYRNVFESEDYFKKIAKQKNIKVIGSYNPFNVDLNASDFYDGMHCNEKGINLLLSQNK